LEEWSNLVCRESSWRVPGTRGFSRVFAKSGKKAPPEKFPSLAGTFLAPGLGVFRDLAAGRVASGHKCHRPLTSDGPKFVELDRLLDAVSTGPKWLERRDVAGVVVNALWKGVRESRYELGAPGH
jgi:hypothetical protein